MEIPSLLTLLCLCHCVKSSEMLFESGESHFYMMISAGGLKNWKSILNGHQFNDPLSNKHAKNITELIPGGSFRSSVSSAPCDQVYIVLYNSVGDALWWINFNGSFGDVNLFSSYRITGSSSILPNNKSIAFKSDTRYQLLIGPTYRNMSAWMVIQNGNGTDETYPLYWFSKDSSTPHTVYNNKTLIKLLGCGTHDNFIDLQMHHEHITNMTVELCNESCRRSAKSLAVLTMGYRCNCGEFGENQTLSNFSMCITPCTGNTSQMCGDSSGEYYSVYRQETEIQPVTMPDLPIKFTNMTTSKRSSLNEMIMVTPEDFPYRPSNYTIGVHLMQSDSTVSSYSLYYDWQDCNGTNKKQLVNQTTLLPQVFSTEIRYETPLLYFGCLWIQFGAATLYSPKVAVTLSFVNGNINFLPADYLAVVGFSNTSSTTTMATTPSTESFYDYQEETDWINFPSSATAGSTEPTGHLTSHRDAETSEPTTNPSNTSKFTVSEGNTMPSSTHTSTHASMITQVTNDPDSVSSTWSSTTTHPTQTSTKISTDTHTTNDPHDVTSSSSTTTYPSHTTSTKTSTITRQETDDPNDVSSTSSGTTTYFTDYDTTDDVTSTYTENTTNCCICLTRVLINITSEELQQKLDDVRKILTVEKETLSSSKRKLISAPDDRLSARGIGYCGIIVLLVALIAVVLMDLNVFYTVVKSRFYTFSNV